MVCFNYMSIWREQWYWKQNEDFWDLLTPDVCCTVGDSGSSDSVMTSQADGCHGCPGCIALATGCCWRCPDWVSEEDIENQSIGSLWYCSGSSDPQRVDLSSTSPTSSVYDKQNSAVVLEATVIVATVQLIHHWTNWQPIHCKWSCMHVRPFPHSTECHSDHQQ